MKKLSVVMVGVMCLCFLGVAPKASAQIIVNFDPYFQDTVLNLLGYNLTSDNDGDGIADADADALVAAVLADTAQPSYGAVSSAWTTNLASMVPVHDAIVVAGYSDATATAVQYILAAALTRGESTYVSGALDGLGLLALMPPSPPDAASAVGAGGDPDNDGQTNVQEYNAVSGNRAQFIANALPQPLAISTQPSNKFAALGSDVTFTVGATGGIVPLHYQWKKNGSTDVGTDSPSYTVTNVQLADTGSTYSCVVTDSDTPTAASVTSNSAVLNVYDPGTVPATNIYGLIVLGLLSVGAGIFAMRRVAHR